MEPGGEWASGFEADSTNQRMEVTAALRACEAIDGPLRIVSDSTYVVNCWRDRWWEGWIKRGWKNASKKPVANRDLWEQLVPHFRDRDDLDLEWVKGHSGNRWNDVADSLAVGAVARREGAQGLGEPPAEVLGGEDLPSPAGLKAPGSTEPATESAPGRSSDSRTPEGTRLVVTGLRNPGLLTSRSAAKKLGEVLSSYSELHPDLVVLTGLRGGAEQLAAQVVAERDLAHVVILPYPDPAARWSAAERARFQQCCDSADRVVILERSRPRDKAAMTDAIARRDGWLRSVADIAVVLTDGSDPEAEQLLRRWEKAIGDDVWRLDVEL